MRTSLRSSEPPAEEDQRRAGVDRHEFEPAARRRPTRRRTSTTCSRWRATACRRAASAATEAPRARAPVAVKGDGEEKARRRSAPSRQRDRPTASGRRQVGRVGVARRLGRRRRIEPARQHRGEHDQHQPRRRTRRTRSSGMPSERQARRRRGVMNGGISRSEPRRRAAHRGVVQPVPRRGAGAFIGLEPAVSRRSDRRSRG